jgi:murein DD-endopeptidase MepM/ murein hydrolase activator NlpD
VFDMEDWDAGAYEANGSNKRSALRWPPIEGIRNLRPFRYSAGLPDIVRDRVTDCPAPDAFYRLPWADGDARGTGQGNNKPTVSHFGSQAFAFDFDFATGDTIRAAHGGRVQWLQESQTTVFDPFEPLTPQNQPFPNGSLENWGNALRIAHGDGTFAWYFHLDTNGVLVSQGQTVQRGQPVAISVNTGRSGGPHLHFQVQDNNANWGQSIQIRFETDGDGPCFIPDSGDTVTSTNANPNYP